MFSRLSLSSCQSAGGLLPVTARASFCVTLGFPARSYDIFGFLVRVLFRAETVGGDWKLWKLPGAVLAKKSPPSTSEGRLCSPQNTYFYGNCRAKVPNILQNGEESWVNRNQHRFQRRFFRRTFFFAFFSGLTRISFRFASLNAIRRSTLPVESKTRISPERKQARFCAYSIACSFCGNTGSTPRASKAFQPQRCGMISITVMFIVIEWIRDKTSGVGSDWRNRKKGSRIVFDKINPRKGPRAVS